MLARSVRPCSLLKSTVIRSAPVRAYSDHHDNHDAHHEEHGHGHDHGHELAESEPIINKNTGIFLGAVASIAGFYYLNKSYKASHDGAALNSIIKDVASPLNDLKENYNAYRERVAKQAALQEMMMFPSEKKTYSNLVTRIDEVPGRLWASGSNTQLNVIHNHSELAPRKTKESPFY
ncbi:hypothetical protein JL09_g2213 [Pichia kudriavzevii]|uniref:Uncharacterized protein n=1 Tax=Pichia kudriavzevii TaxID=4909 RepID=A0A099P379_PICKU|nr:hypothetical protein JL09_g2213 [Pichia kudriavzevii]